MLDDDDRNDNTTMIDNYHNNADKRVDTKSVKFTETHPGGRFLYLKKRKFEVVLMINLPKRSMCRIKDLYLDNMALFTHVTENRESCAKFVLLMLYPCRKKDDVLLNGSYWEN